jgi:hypothetical protein
MSRITDVAISKVMWAVGWFYHRPHFKRWLLLEDIKHKIIQAIAQKDKDFPDLLFSYLSIAFRLPVWVMSGVRWDTLFYLFVLSAGKNTPKVEIPLLKAKSDKKNKKDSWDYEGRTWYMYCHILAQKYGWSYSEIENLDVDVALALVQEVLTDEQLDREFLWTMSDRSYTYDYKSKVGKPNPLDRPYWMIAKIEPPKKSMIPMDMMPMGGIDWSAVPAEFRPKLPEPKSGEMSGL